MDQHPIILAHQSYLLVTPNRARPSAFFAFLLLLRNPHDALASSLIRGTLPRPILRSRSELHAMPNLSQQRSSLWLPCSPKPANKSANKVPSGFGERFLSEDPPPTVSIRKHYNAGRNSLPMGILKRSVKTKSAECSSILGPHRL